MKYLAHTDKYIVEIVTTKSLYKLPSGNEIKYLASALEVIVPRLTSQSDHSVGPQGTTNARNNQ